jgi:hypothetical protein
MEYMPGIPPLGQVSDIAGVLMRAKRGLATGSSAITNDVVCDSTLFINHQPKI